MVAIRRSLRRGLGWSYQWLGSAAGSVTFRPQITELFRRRRRAAGLGKTIQAAQHESPDGVIREGRVPDGYGSVQMQMWRPGHFRWPGNHVAAVDRAMASVLATGLYANRPTANRFMQAMAGLHYDECVGAPARWTYGTAGLASGVLFDTRVMTWWMQRRRASPATARVAPQLATVNEA